MKIEEKIDDNDLLKNGLLPLDPMADSVPMRKPKNQKTVRKNYHLTEGGNGERFADNFRGEVLWCQGNKSWFVWNGARWERDNMLDVQLRAKKIVQDLYNDAASEPDKSKQETLFKHYFKAHKPYAINSMLEYARSEPHIPVELLDFDKNNQLLNLANGTLNLKTEILQEHSSEDMLTRMAPVEYNPKASPYPALWIAFLNKIFCGDEELIGFIQRAVGYSLTSDTSERCIFFLHGSGRNGKSTLLSILQALLGTADEDGYSLQTPTETLMQRHGDRGVPNDVARLKGARLVTASESAEGKRLDEGLIKQLAGGEDFISARFMRGEWFDFKPEMKLWFASNHKPQIRGTDDAIWDRIRLIPFNYRITDEEKDGKLFEKLKHELPGILNWSLEGLAQWRENGLQAPQIVKSAVTAYRQSQDALGDFFKEDLEFSQNDDGSTVAEVFRHYQKWCERSGEKSLSKRRLGAAIRERGYQTKRGSGGVRYWQGIRIITDSHRALREK
jgi:putative DNA primase/helicase